MDNLGDSFFEMMVLMTTSNFPDVMLPAYQRNRVYSLFFVIYLLVGMFIILNLMLAIIYSNFKSLFEKQIEDMQDTRNQYFYEQFYKLSKGNEYLDEIQMYKCFLLIHGLVNRKASVKLSPEEEEQIANLY